jgi:hypothetical protein
MASTEHHEWQTEALAAINRFLSGIDTKDCGELPLMMP